MYRITPAYAGKREFHLISFRYLRDHPRLRGEKSSVRTKTTQRQGSPPLTRGKVAHHTRARIYMAFSGNLFLFALQHTIRARVYIWGSPPLTRGKDFTMAKTLIDQGITPAYAGKSCKVRSQHITVEDHPRLRGEKISLSKRMFSLQGSPPLTRGKGSRKTEFPVNNRITPAYAGKRDHQQSDRPAL